MIWFWERKELTVTYDLSRRGRILDLLEANGIDYALKTSGRDAVSTRRGSMGSFGENPQYSVCCYIYVRRSDFDRAKHLLSQV